MWSPSPVRPASPLLVPSWTAAVSVRSWLLGPECRERAKTITAKVKLAGPWREKVAVTDPSGEKAPRYIISDRPMTEEEWARERCGE